MQLQTPSTACFIAAPPLTPPSLHRRRRCLRTTPHATTPPPTPAPPLSRALSEIATFTGTPPEARALTTRLINTLVTVPTAAAPDTATPLFRALHAQSLLRAFGTSRQPAGSKPPQKRVSAARLAAQAGLPLAALAPRRATVLAWQLAGVGVVAAIVQLTRVFGAEQLARPLLFSVGVGLAADRVLLRGVLFEAVYRAVLPGYEEKVLKHEAGHFLAAYLHGLAVRGYVLSAGEAMRAGIPGQAGTLFSDEEMLEELRMGRLSNRAIDRFSIVSMAGIAAEAIHYGEAEGGESDVEALLRLLTTLQPPWTEDSVRSQARWAVLEAILLLRRNEGSFRALCEAMRGRKSLGDCVLCIEDNFVPAETAVPGEDGAEVLAVGDEESLRRREEAILAELERIRRKVDKLDGE